MEESTLETRIKDFKKAACIELCTAGDLDCGKCPMDTDNFAKTPIREMIRIRKGDKKQ